MGFDRFGSIHTNRERWLAVLFGGLLCALALRGYPHLASNLELLRLLRSSDRDVELSAVSTVRNPRAIWLMGKDLIDIGNPKTYSTALEYWRMTPQWSVTMLTAHAHQAFNTGYNRESIRWAQLALELDPNLIDLVFLAAQAANNSQQWAPAVGLWKTGFAHDRFDAADYSDVTYATFLSQYGWALYQSGDVDQGRRYLHHATTLQPRNWAVNEAYLRFLENEATSLEYERQLNKVREIFPSSVVLLRSLGELAMQERQYEKAESYFVAVLEQRPAWAPVAGQLGRLYFVSGRLELAKDMYQRAVDVAPEEAQYHIALIETLRAMNDSETEADHLRRLKEQHYNTYVEVQRQLEAQAAERTDNP